VDVVPEKDVTEKPLVAMITGMLDLIGSAKFSELPGRKIRKEGFAAPDFRNPFFGQIGDRHKRALFLVGSPKVQSTSSAIGEEFMARLRNRGWETGMRRVLPSLKKEGKWGDLIHELEKADLVALISPLYVDSLPAAVTQALERIARHRKDGTGQPDQGFMAILNCGFPEAFHNYTGLAIARHFAEETGFQWLGGLGLGMGGAIDGKPLAQRGRMVRNAVKALDITAASIDMGGPVPSEAVELMGRPFLARWLYILAGNRGWKRMAKKHGVKGDLNARPYQKGTRAG